MIWSAITAIFGNRKPRRVRLKMTQQDAFGERLESRVVMSATTLNTAALQSLSSFDSEPNNTRGAADFVRSFGAGSHSTTVYGSTGSGTDTQDWARFTVSGRTSGTIQLSGMTQDLNIELLNSSGTRINRSTLGKTSLGIPRTDTITLTNLAAGTYYVRVIPGVIGARSAYALRFGLTVSTTSTPTPLFDTEPNNTRGTADFVRSFGVGTHSKTVYGNTGSGSDLHDWARFTLSGRTSGTIQLSGMTQDLDLELYNSSGTRIDRSIRSGKSTDTITLKSLAAGTYYVRVTPGVTGARSAYALRFGLTVSRTAPTATSLGTIGSGQFDVKRTDRLGVNGDTSDWYKFTVQSGKESTLRLRYAVTQGSIRNLSYRVEDASGKVILLKSSSTSTSTSRDLTLSSAASRLAPGTYYIRFTSASNANLIYNFRVTGTPNTRVNPDPNGTSNVRTAALSLGTSGSSQFDVKRSERLGVKGDTSDWYKFTVQSGKESTFRLRYAVTQGSIRNLSYRVEDASGNVISLKSTSTSTSRDITLSSAASRLAPGTYYIRFTSASNANLIYNFRVTATPNTLVNPDPNGPNNSLQQVTLLRRSGDGTIPAVMFDRLTPNDKDDFFRVRGPAFKIVVTDGDPNDLRISVFAIYRFGIVPAFSDLTEQRIGRTIEVSKKKSDDFSAPTPGTIPLGHIIQVTSLNSIKTIQYRIES
jgi:hypothetical protein